MTAEMQWTLNNECSMKKFNKTFNKMFMDISKFQNVTSESRHRKTSTSNAKV
jgi:hypothetical protein